MTKTLAIIFGIILVLLGLLGFTSNPLIGANALFAADAMLDSIYIILGAILLIVAFWASESSRVWLKIVGVITFLIGLIGLFSVPSAGGMLLGIAYANGASNWLNLVAGVVIFIAGMYGKDGAAPAGGGMSPPSGSAQMPPEQPRAM
ncbi:MAG TPA: hypothetical protein VMV50_01390 [Candidatus Paceibacterota bacterium]|nr:hypothetical protein [Candidatus Paceibacterota bacterium]